MPSSYGVPIDDDRLGSYVWVANTRGWGLLDDDQPAVLLVGGGARLDAALERERAGLVGREVHQRGPPGKDALLHAVGVEREAVLAVGGGQAEPHGIALAQVDH